MVLKPGHDWFYAYYRDMALMLRLGMTPKEIQMEALGCADGPSSGGRQMPSHWGHARLNVVSRSSVTGTQYLQAVGCSHAGRYISIVEECRKRGLRHQTDEITYVSGGEGSTSEGEFWEALNTACNLKLPILFLNEDNKYAISVPVEAQTAGGTIGALVKDWPGLRYEELDGCDPLECYRVLSDVVAGMRRRREGHALVQAHVVRPYSHSLSDDERLYKPERERQEEARKDPITRFEKYLLREGLADADLLARMKESIDQEVSAATQEAAAAARPAPDTIYSHVCSPDVDPASGAFSTMPDLQGDPKTMVDLLNACLRDEMERDPRIVIFGEDVADATREEALAEVKGKGGVFKVTHNLQRRFGRERVFNSPLAEANIVGRAIGMATRGLKPVVEIQFLDYIWPAFMQIRDELAVQQRILLPRRDPGRFRRLPGRRRPLPQPVRRGPLHAHAGASRGDAGNGAGRQRAAPHRHPLRRSGDLPGAQAPLPPDLQQVPLPRPRLPHSFREGPDGPGGQRHHSRHLRRHGGAIDPGRPPGPGGERDPCRGDRSPEPLPPSTGAPSRPP